MYKLTVNTYYIIKGRKILSSELFGDWLEYINKGDQISIRFYSYLIDDFPFGTVSHVS